MRSELVAEGQKHNWRTRMVAAGVAAAALLAGCTAENGGDMMSGTPRTSPTATPNFTPTPLPSESTIPVTTAPPESVITPTVSVTVTATESSHTAPTATVQPNIPVVFNLNYDGLMSNGKCLGGGERPCFAPIKRTPHRSPPDTDMRTDPNIINILTPNPDGTIWPHEAAGGKPSDSLTAVCRVYGDDIYGFDTAHTSNVWLAVIVPAVHSKTGTNMVGYTPERWAQMGKGIVLNVCGPAHNPANARVVLEPTP